MDFSRTEAGAAQGRVGQATCSRLAFGGRFWVEGSALTSELSRQGQAGLAAAQGLVSAIVAVTLRSEGPSW
ncbi:MAG: hypothetical protein B7Z44_02210 [Caulobacter sp. 12-67-6]|nr:MAG: hypothetical protein B7Z44_02210 [Caulobacter sp. 12-67-6]